MRTESKANENSPVGLVEEIAPKSSWRVTKVEILPEFQLRVEFADGMTGMVKMARFLHSAQAGIFASLLDPTLFAQAKLEYGAVTWPGELDLAPDAMHEAISKHGEWSL